MYYFDQRKPAIPSVNFITCPEIAKNIGLVVKL